MSEANVEAIVAEPVVRFSGERVVLPEATQAKINAFWDMLVESGKKVTRGEVFTVTRVERDEVSGRMKVLVELTDYAHYLYCDRVDAVCDGFPVRIIHPSVLVETVDDQIVFGVMGEETARAGMYQMSGGGLEHGDVVDGVFDVSRRAAEELVEELGLDAHGSSFEGARVQSFGPAYFKSGGHNEKMTVVYRARIMETAAEFREAYDTWAHDEIKAGRTPEFARIVTLARTKDALMDFVEQSDAQFDEAIVLVFTYIAENECE